MSSLLLISKYIDALNEKIGLTISWALLAAVFICSGNALIRYLFNTSSNAWLEIQWYLFSAIFLLASSYTLRRNEHVRIDVIVGKFSKRMQVWIDVFGFAFFLLPATVLILYFATPFAFESIRNQEVSSNAGGLIVWPAKLLIPLGFLLLTLQGISELIKRIAYLLGKVELSAFEKETVTPEDEILAIKAANQLP
jgi:TRAP-type mannitol/chloroaromatic compound transport system permease small subunit